MKYSLRNIKKMSERERVAYWFQSFRASFNTETMEINKNCCKKEHYSEWVSLGHEFIEAFWVAVEEFDWFTVQEGEFINFMREHINSFEK